jgi:hypothetical protein
MPYAVDFNEVSTVGLESSPVAAALAGLRAHEARYFKNRYDNVFTVKPARDAKTTIDWVHRIFMEERGIVISSRPSLEATAFQSRTSESPTSSTRARCPSAYRCLSGTGTPARTRAGASREDPPPRVQPPSTSTASSLPSLRVVAAAALPPARYQAKCRPLLLLRLSLQRARRREANEPPSPGQPYPQPR